MALTRTRKVLIALGVLLLLLGGAVVVLPPLLFGDRVDYSQVVSIKTTQAYQDPALLEKAWALPVAALYRQAVDYQRNPSFCGPTSVVNVLRSLGQAGDQQTVLADTGVSTFLGLLPGGVTLDQLAAIARKRTGRKVTVLRDLDLAGFRAELGRVNDPALRYTINFSRGPLFGQGGGHHSPIAGYLAAEDLVLVLDVNQKYKPWLVSSERLYQAMNTTDRGAHLKRGLLRIE